VSIERCPDCGFLYSTEWGCTYCHPVKEVKRKKSNNIESRETKEEGPTGEGYLPFPAVQ
jgi:hypothetical protein